MPWNIIYYITLNIHIFEDFTSEISRNIFGLDKNYEIYDNCISKFKNFK